MLRDWPNSDLYPACRIVMAQVAVITGDQVERDRTRLASSYRQHCDSSRMSRRCRNGESLAIATLSVYMVGSYQYIWLPCIHEEIFKAYNRSIEKEYESGL